jgi:hypothetical protein
MWTEFILGICLYVGPLAALPLLIRRQPVARKVAALAVVVAPLVGAAIYLLKHQKFSLASLVLIYPFALLPLGFWAALIGALTTPIMLYLKQFGWITLLLAAPPSGAVIGSVFMYGFAYLVRVIQQPVNPIDFRSTLFAG